MKCPLNCSYNRSTTICSVPFPEARSGLKRFCEEAAFYTVGCHSGEGLAWKQCKVVRTVALFLARLGKPWCGNSLGIWNQRWCGFPPPPSAWKRGGKGSQAKTEGWGEMVCIWGVHGKVVSFFHDFLFSVSHSREPSLCNLGTCKVVLSLQWWSLNSSYLITSQLCRLCDPG